MSSLSPFDMEYLKRVNISWDGDERGPGATEHAHVQMAREGAECMRQTMGDTSAACLSNNHEACPGFPQGCRCSCHWLYGHLREASEASRMRRHNDPQQREACNGKLCIIAADDDAARQVAELIGLANSAWEFVYDADVFMGSVVTARVLIMPSAISHPNFNEIMIALRIIPDAKIWRFQPVTRGQLL